MANGILEISQMGPCPICGNTHDYCGYLPIGDGRYLNLCFRSQADYDQMGTDGKSYVFLGIGKEGGAHVFEEYQQHKERICEENGGWEYSECSALNPCKICGNTSFCKHMCHVDGTEFSLCATENRKYVVNGDKEYVFVKRTNNGFSRYQEKGARRQMINAWKSGKKEEKQENKEFRAAQPKYVKKQIVQENKITPREPEYLDKIYRYLLELLVLEPDHEFYMTMEGWNGTLLKKHNIKSFPENDFFRDNYKNYPSYNPRREDIARNIMEKFGEDALLGVPGAYRNKKGVWTFAGPKGIIFPCYDVNGYLYGLRIRKDYMDVAAKVNQEKDGVLSFFSYGEKKQIEPMKGIYVLKNGQKCYDKQNGKYRPLSSYREDKEKLKKGVIVNAYDSGCSSGNKLSFYTNPGDDMTICYLTEGEKKAAFSNSLLKAPVISFPGVNSIGLLFMEANGKKVVDILYDMGVRMFIVAFDADKETNKHVLHYEQSLIQKLKDANYAVATAYWDMFYGKGLDDLLKNGFRPDYDFV